jgi:hypothetical protein
MGGDADSGSMSSVYFIGSGGNAPVKIGFAIDPELRLRELQCGNHTVLRVLATTPGGQRLEAEYHKRFAAHRIRGEWFRRHPDVGAEIDRIWKARWTAGDAKARAIMEEWEAAQRDIEARNEKRAKRSRPPLRLAAPFPNPTTDCEGRGKS